MVLFKKILLGWIFGLCFAVSFCSFFDFSDFLLFHTFFRFIFDLFLIASIII